MSKTTNRLGGIGDAFADRNFRYYSLGTVTAWIGYFIQLVAISWYAWELTESTAWLAIIALFDIVPNILLAPIAGALADRVDKYRLMGLISLLALIQAIITATLAWLNILTIWPFAFLVLIHGIIISFMVPAMYGILPRFVARARLTSALAVSSSYSQLAIFLGPAIAGWVISSYGVAVAFALNALGYILYLISWANLKDHDEYAPPKPSNNSFFGDIIAGLKYIQGHKGIRTCLILLLAGDTLSAGIFFMAPAFAEQILGMGVIGVSLILAAKGIGAVIAAIHIAYGGERVATPSRMLCGLGLFIIAVFIAYLSTNTILTITAFVLVGLAGETYSTVMMSLVQLSVTEEQRGRVIGSLFMLSQLASAIGTYLIGYYALRHGLVTPTLTVATLCLILWFLFFLKREKLTNQFHNNP